ncbi:hypothetical protein ACIBO2_26220 [Nonomuraea sp. NPDC050022]|uniref:hypothetical protein n=1 Tax=Nonomuraea sp. NPDC050022 TaxID=3364358 RepID=UPI003796B410
MTPEPPRAYTLVQGKDGLTYVYNGGEQESRRGIRAAHPTIRAGLEALVTSLNDPRAPIDRRLNLLAFEIMLKIW